MKKNSNIRIGICMMLSLTSCAKLSSSTAPCNNAGYYASQSECQKSVSQGGCSSVTVQTVDQSNLVCWKASGSALQNGSVSTQSDSSTSTSTNTQTTVGCSGVQSPPWTLGAWSPSACGPGVQIRTRSVACDYACPCAQPMPSNVESCVPNLYGGHHYESECGTAGGTLEWIDGKRFCVFRDKPIPGMAGTNNDERTDAVCPSGWTPIYSGQNKLITTSPRSAENHTNCVGGRATVSTGYHSAFLPAYPVESVQYCTWRNCFTCKRWETKFALITKIACY